MKRGKAKITVFLDVTPCNLVQVYQRFGRTYWLHPQGRRLSHESKGSIKSVEKYGMDNWIILLAACLNGLIFEPEDGSSRFLHYVGKVLPDDKASYPRRSPFTVTAMRTSTLTRGKVFCTTQLWVFQAILLNTRKKASQSLQNLSPSHFHHWQGGGAYTFHAQRQL
jgi:hypothetical protein